MLIRPWTGAELLNWRTPGFRPIGDESGGVIKGEESRPRPRWKYRRWRLRRGSSSTVPPSDHSAPRGASSLSTIANSLPWKSSWRSRACTRALIGGQLLVSQPVPLSDAEQVRHRRRRSEIARQDRVDLVLDPGPLPRKMRSPRELPAQAADRSSGSQTGGRKSAAAAAPRSWRRPCRS